jgi:hypothetical protein
MRLEHRVSTTESSTGDASIAETRTSGRREHRVSVNTSLHLLTFPPIQ